MKTDLIVKALGAVLLLVAVAAAGFYAGTFTGRRRVEEEAVTNGARPRSEMAARLAALPHVTEVIEGRRRDETIYYVVLDEDAADDDARQAFLAALDLALADRLARDRIVLIRREGGHMLRWHLEDGAVGERAP